jgi:hypothetical protein
LPSISIYACFDGTYWVLMLPSEYWFQHVKANWRSLCIHKTRIAFARSFALHIFERSSRGRNTTLALCEMYWVHLDRFEWSCDGYTLVEPKRITVVVCFIWVSSHVHTTAMEFDARRMYWNLQSATCAATLRLSL